MFHVLCYMLHLGIFFHPDYTVGTGVTPVQPRTKGGTQVADYAAGWDMLPTLKM